MIQNIDYVNYLLKHYNRNIFIIIKSKHTKVQLLGMVFMLQRAEYLLKCEIQFFTKSLKLYYNKFSLYADNTNNNNLISGLESTEKNICLRGKNVP